MPLDVEAEIDTDGNVVTDMADRVVLNGAQVTAAQGIVEAVSAGRLPRDTGLNMLIEFFAVNNFTASPDTFIWNLST